jgi:hypothetical protein
LFRQSVDMWRDALHAASEGSDRIEIHVKFVANLIEVIEKCYFCGKERIAEIFDCF